MLPFLGAFAQHMQQQTALRALTNAQIEEKAEKQRKLAFKRKLFADGQQFSQRLAQSAKTKPQQAYIELSILYYDLNYYQLEINDFEDPKEKEDFILFVRKLQNIQQEITSNISDAQTDLCKKYLNTLSDYNFTSKTFELLKIYQNWENVSRQLEGAQKAESNLRRFAWGASAMVFLLLIGTFMLFSNSMGFKNAAEYIILWLLAGVFTGIAIRIVYQSRKPKNIEQLKRDYVVLKKNCRADNQEYWDEVWDTFGSDPVPDDLEARQAKLMQQLEWIGKNELGLHEDDPVE
jgi:hypothetical protein